MHANRSVSLSLFDTGPAGHQLDRSTLNTWRSHKRGVTKKKKVPVRLLANAESIQTLLSNLIGNGLHYTESGGNVAVTLEDREGRWCWCLKIPASVSQPRACRIYLSAFTEWTNRVPAVWVGLDSDWLLSRQSWMRIKVLFGWKARSVKAADSLCCCRFAALRRSLLEQIRVRIHLNNLSE